MLRSLCLILLTAFLICKATDVASLLLAKEKSSVVCDSGTCDNEEKTEVEKINDDQLLISNSVYFDKFCLSIPLKNSFTYSVSFRTEIFHNLLSPPPELI
ncbi:hypothetical protein [Dyadobacter pollutisoli]|uniref:Uncharacterized protein n=1 Tax=Dyadobacter pollutisoli TaxID=2910158 RepID=A0A9E8SLT6_9BACT|nr:hypothetical protein [Dyadobacter pollutisoli]WAC12106.1 hypothetical protein ON006_30810 [Dyadobacter pollutisoli]